MSKLKIKNPEFVPYEYLISIPYTRGEKHDKNKEELQKTGEKEPKHGVENEKMSKDEESKEEKKEEKAGAKKEEKTKK